MCCLKAICSISFAFKSHILAQRKKYFPMSSMLLLFLDINDNFGSNITFKIFSKCVFQEHRATYDCYTQHTFAYKCLIYWTLQSKTSVRMPLKNHPSPVLHNVASSPTICNSKGFSSAALQPALHLQLFYLSGHDSVFLKLLWQCFSLFLLFACCCSHNLAPANPNITVMSDSSC